MAEGISRERIAKLIDVSVGSLQVTCSRLGISLRRSGTRCARVLSGPNPLPMVGHMHIGRLALEAEARNMSMAQLLTAIATMAVKKDLIGIKTRASRRKSLPPPPGQVSAPSDRPADAVACKYGKLQNL